MPDEIVTMIEDEPTPVPVVAPPASTAPAAAPAKPPRPQEPFDPARLGSFIATHPEAKEYLREALGVNKMEIEQALDKSCLAHGVDAATAAEYRDLLVGQTPDETRARVEKFAKLRATLPGQQAVTASAAAPPVAQAPVPQYQAPPPLLTSVSADVDVTKLSFDDQCKLLMELAQKDW